MRLGSICKMKNGGTPSTKNPSYYLGSIPWISTVSLGPNYIDGTAAKAFISEEAVSNSAAKIIPPGSLLVGTRVGVGKSSITTVPLATNQDIVSLIDIDSRLKPLFLKFFLDSKASYFESRKKGATILGITTDDLKLLDVPEKTLQEQGAICNVMCYIQRSIQAQRNSILRLNEQVKSLFNEMFGDPELYEEKWPCNPMGTCVTVIGGYAFKSSSFLKEGVPVLKIGNINTGTLRTTNLVYWNDNPALERYSLKPGDLVMSLTGTAGKDDYGNVCIITDAFPKYYLNQRNAKLVCKDFVHPLFLKVLLSLPMVKQRLVGRDHGVRQGNILNKDLEQLVIPMPPYGLQNRFADAYLQIDKLRFNYQRQIEVLQELMDKKMEEYFGGGAS